MNEKNKAFLKKAIIYILVFSLGITAGIMATKSSENYKNTFSLSEKLTFGSYHLLTSLDSAFDNNLPPERILEDLTNLNFIASLAIGSNGVFMVGYDEDISFDELNVLFDCSVKAKFIAKDLAAGKDISAEDREWLKKFDSAVDAAYAAHSGPSYRVLIENLIEQKLQPKE